MLSFDVILEFPGQMVKHVCHATGVSIAVCSEYCSSPLYFFYLLDEAVLVRIPNCVAIF